MPELPEVETITNDLNEAISDLTIKDVELFWPKYIASPSPKDFIKKILGKRILRVKRRGKYIVYHLSSNFRLLQHLRMTGRALVMDPREPLSKHTHITITLSKNKHLRVEDARKFGRLWLFSKEQAKNYFIAKQIGPEPLSEALNPQILALKLKTRKNRIKSLLLDQSVIAGLGNIYVDEALFMAGISPLKQANKISLVRLQKLLPSIQETLKKAINSRGTSFSDYLDGLGNAGEFVNFLNVYGRAGLPCHKCDTILKKTTISSRTTVYCPRCQK